MQNKPKMLPDCWQCGKPNSGEFLAWDWNLCGACWADMHDLAPTLNKKSANKEQTNVNQ